jgi:hypothetical protein
MICEVCGDNVFAWADLHGQVVCMTCGAPYQIKAFRGASPDRKYPYCTLNKEFMLVFKEYWTTTKQRCRLGTYIGILKDVVEERKKFEDWLKQNHPNWLED